MNPTFNDPFEAGHDHVFLGAGHEANERKTWWVIALCSAMMLAEIVGGKLFGSLALMADGLHMSTHAGAMLIAALAYTYARKHATDPRFVFGTGKLGDLAGFASAIILAMIALLIGYEAVVRLLSPIPIHFTEAISIAALGLIVNIASAWLLSGSDHHGHSHGQGHAHPAGHSHAHDDEVQFLDLPDGLVALSIFEDGMPPVFRISTDRLDAELPSDNVQVTTIRFDGAQQVFAFRMDAGFLQSTTAIPEPHTFDAIVTVEDKNYKVAFEEPLHDDADVDARDHNMRAAYMHIIADAAVSVLAIIGLLLAKLFGWFWMDPLAGIVGAFVIANWSYGLIRNAGSNLVDFSPGDAMANKVRSAVDAVGDKLIDLHVWRLGPGHFGAMVCVVTSDAQHESTFYQNLLRPVKGLSHVTVEVHNRHTLVA